MDQFKIIIWDFDGVIIFSNEVREEGFRVIFRNYSEQKIKDLLSYHRANGGLSRYVKIKYFHENILGQPINKEDIQTLADEFSEVMKKQLTNKSLLNKDWLDLMVKADTKFVHHIASGSDGRELNLLCEALGIDHYFESINGSPTPKNTLVANIIKGNNYNTEDIVLIGDAINDYEAAKINRIAFKGYNNAELIKYGNYLTHLNQAF